MAKLWQFLRGHSKPAFSQKVQGADQGKFFKNRPKSKPRLKRRKALLRKWYYPLIIMHLGTRTGEDFGANSGFKSARMAKLWQFSQGHPKPTFSEKVQRGDQGKFFENRPKSSLRLKGPKALCRKWYYPRKAKRLDKILAQKAAPKVLERRSYGNFCKVTQNSHFLKKCKGGTKGNFSKIAQKVALASKGQEHSGANGIIL